MTDGLATYQVGRYAAKELKPAAEPQLTAAGVCRPDASSDVRAR